LAAGASTQTNAPEAVTINIDQKLPREVSLTTGQSVFFYRKNAASANAAPTIYAGGSFEPVDAADFPAVKGATVLKGFRANGVKGGTVSVYLPTKNNQSTRVDVKLAVKPTLVIGGSNDGGANIMEDLYQRDSGNKNIIISPPSISLALSLAFNGADGTTAT